jgi:hypothetical protein
VWFVLLLAFNTETTKNHEEPRSGFRRQIAVGRPSTVAHATALTKTFVELGAFVGNRNSGLPLEGDFRLLQLVAGQPS